MSFTYVNKTIDEKGHVRYECKCSMCGNTVFYGRKVNSSPICAKCQDREVNAKWFQRAKALSAKSAYEDCLINYQKMERVAFEDWLIRKVEE